MSSNASFSRQKNPVLKIAQISVVALAAASIAAPVAFAAGSGGGSGLSEMQSKQSDPTVAFNEGIAALQESDYKTAEKKFGEVLAVARDHPEANYYMALAKVGRGKEKSAVRYFKRAIKARPSFVEAREQLALTYVKLDESDKAQEQLEKINGILADCDKEECAEAFVTRTNQAIANVEAALNGGGETQEQSALPMSNWLVAGITMQGREIGEIRYGEAVRLIHQDRYEDAIAQLYQASAIVGPHPDILNYLGYSHRKLGKFDKAQGYYAQALKINPDHLGATEYLGELYLEIGEIKKAKRQLAKLDRLCDFGCAEREDLARQIDIKTSVRSASRQ